MDYSNQCPPPPGKLYILNEALIEEMAARYAADPNDPEVRAFVKQLPRPKYRVETHDGARFLEWDKEVSEEWCEQHLDVGASLQEARDHVARLKEAEAHRGPTKQIVGPSTKPYPSRGELAELSRVHASQAIGSLYNVPTPLVPPTRCHLVIKFIPVDQPVPADDAGDIVLPNVEIEASMELGIKLATIQDDAGAKRPVFTHGGCLRYDYSGQQRVMLRAWKGCPSYNAFEALEGYHCPDHGASGCPFECRTPKIPTT